jgi:hypothetical protein
MDKFIKDAMCKFIENYTKILNKEQKDWYDKDINHNEYFYILKKPDTNRYKLGYTRNIKSRIRQLQTGSDEKIQCVASFKFFSQVARPVESLIKIKYSSYKTIGEWFELTDSKLQELMNYICELPFVIDKVEKSTCCICNERFNNEYFYCMFDYRNRPILNMITTHAKKHTDETYEFGNISYKDLFLDYYYKIKKTVYFIE